MVNLVTNIVSNIWYALLLLMVLTIFLHFFLVYPKNLTKKQWKKIDYIWISLTAVGLIGATNNVKLMINKSNSYIASQRIPFQFKNLSSALSTGSQTVCREYVRNEYSPDNFDSIVKDYNNSCEWSRKIYRIVSSVDTTNYRMIDVSTIPPLETVDNRWYKDWVLDSIKEYNELVKEKDESEIVISTNSGIELLFFTPLFLILGLAIRITKVTGEIRHEKG